MFTFYLHVTWAFIYTPQLYIYASIYDCIYINIKYFFKTVQRSGAPFPYIRLPCCHFVLFCHPLAVRTGIAPSRSCLYEMFKAISSSLLNPRNSSFASCALSVRCLPLRSVLARWICPASLILAASSLSKFSELGLTSLPSRPPSHRRGDTDPEVTGHFLNPFGVLPALLCLR